MKSASGASASFSSLAPDLPRLCGDPVQIQQVLVNLVSNAFDAIASAQPLDPTVLIQTRTADSGGVEFCVTDNGEGIDQERLTKVFDAYFSTRAGGLGMGLAISRTIIEAHQGRITVDVPRPKSRQPSGSRSRLAVATMTEPTVYIVDDDPDMRDSLRWLIKTVGLRAETFPSAAGFLRDFAPNGPGCLILDVRMPGTSGLDLFEELVARGEGMPVIFITAYADVADGGPRDEVRGGRVCREAVQPPDSSGQGPARDQGRRQSPQPSGRQRDGPGETPKTDREGAGGPGVDQGGTAEQGDRHPAGDHAPCRRVEAVEPDAQARCPHAGRALAADDRPGGGADDSSRGRLRSRQHLGRRADPRDTTVRPFGHGRAPLFQQLCSIVGREPLSGAMGTTLRFCASS